MFYQVEWWEGGMLKNVHITVYQSPHEDLNYEQNVTFNLVHFQEVKMLICKWMTQNDIPRNMANCYWTHNLLQKINARSEKKFGT